MLVNQKLRDALVGGSSVSVSPRMRCSVNHSRSLPRSMVQRQMMSNRHGDMGHCLLEQSLARMLRVLEMRRS